MRGSSIHNGDVLNHVFDKLIKTIVAYRDTVPSLADLEQSLIEILPDNASVVFNEHELIKFFENFQRVLREYGDKSFIGKEIFENVTADLFHGVLPNKIPLHEGEYYINSIGSISNN